ncbi:hypothetical protein PID88_002453 [Enterococcus hirae]|nr:hypothetical protein [Enterococcus hirae]
MKILVVNAWDLLKLPPVITLVNVLSNLEYKVTLITEGDYEDIREIIPASVEVINVNIKSNGNVLTSFSNFLSRKKVLRKIVADKMKYHDILWTTTDLTAREIGNDLFKYKHVMQLMELIEDMPMFPYQNIIKANLKEYAKNAYAVVVPEYNRAHILKTWWGLNKTPYILPNKQIYSEKIKSNNNLEEILEDIYDRKLILYQGVFKKERPLENFAKLSDKLPDDYLVCFMGPANSYIKSISRKYPKVKIIPFINPPEHLLVTKRAHIGLLPYLPNFEKGQHYSILNSLYSAPNKLFEYAEFGIPMLGTKVPGIEVPLSMNNMGFSSNLDIDSLLNAIDNIEKNYDIYSSNAKKFYDKTDLHSIVKEIIIDE